MNIHSSGCGWHSGLDNGTREKKINESVCLLTYQHKYLVTHMWQQI